MKGLLFFDIYPSILRCLAPVEGNRLKMMNKKKWFTPLKTSFGLFGCSLKQKKARTIALYVYRKHCHIQFMILYLFNYMQYAITFGYLNVLYYILHLAGGISYDKASLLKYATHQDIFDSLKELND